MKKVFIVIFASVISISAFAQKGEFRGGANLYYSSEVETLGLGIKAQYYITDEIRPEVSLNYFFEKNDHSICEFNANFHYLFDFDAISVYPLGGLNYSSISSSDNKLGLNLGGGVEYPLNDKVTLGAELKYTLNSIYKNTQLILGVGITYRF